LARDNSKGLSFGLSPIVRLNDHFTFNLAFGYEKIIRDFGFAGKQDDLVIFGNRNINTFENSATGKYLFKNNISLSLVARHYYKQGMYKSFYTLLESGNLLPNASYIENKDFSFNSFNVDMVFAWIFAPGSSLNLVWKNEIVGEKRNVAGNYFTNLDETFHEPQMNNISLKVLYYIDYQKLSSKRKSK
jgi:hypothetical protein